MTYREQEFAERCYCEQPARARCRMCNRPRCAAHVGRRGLCHRCADAVTFEMEGRSGARWIAGGTLTVGVSLATMVGHVPTIGVPIALVCGVATYFVYGALLRRALMRRLAPRLAASTGEVEPVRIYDEPRNPFGKRPGRLGW